MTSLPVIIALAVAGIPAMLAALWGTHILLGRLCLRHARRFCRRTGLQVSRARWQPEFERRRGRGRGAKTEFTLVQLDCLDGRQQRRLVLLSVWPLGVRKTVKDEPYPDSYDDRWPEVHARLSDAGPG